MSPPTSFSDAEKLKLLQSSTEILQKLRAESRDESSTAIRSWINQTELPPTASDQCRFFELHGFLHVPNFCNAAECEEMKARMEEMVEDEWLPDKQIDSFGTNTKENTARGDYFLESSDKVHYFAEPVAMEDGKLKPEYKSNKLAALNKAGHALHLPTSCTTGTANSTTATATHDDDSPNTTAGNPFYKYCVSDKIRDLVLDLGWKDPVVPQSMYIFKQPVLGGAVHSHQDSTFLYTTPKQSCLGLWLALDPATLDNGCLWVRPKSHCEAVRRQFKRNPEYFEKKNLKAPQFVMDDLMTNDKETVEWDGDLPDDLLKAGFVPIPCQAGDLLVFNGELDHLSLPNQSHLPRHTFQLHLVEGASVQWSPHNWLQYPAGKPFLRLRDETPGMAS